MLAMMISPLDSLEVKPANRGRQPLHRTRTLDASVSNFGRLDREDHEQHEDETTRQQLPIHHHKPKKNVTFTDQSEWECHQLEPFMSDESQLKDFWVLPEELKDIKMQGFMDCKEARRSGLAALLTEIYGTGSPRENQDRLNYWCRMASPCRGLERFANEELSKRRAIYRKRAIVSVLEAQQQLKNEKGIDTANVLRRLSEAYTEKARNFATALAVADYHAIHTPPHPPTTTTTTTTATTTTTLQAGEAKVETTGEGTTSNKTKGQQQPRKSRTERMKERAAAIDQKNPQQPNSNNPQPADQQGDNNNGLFRRNNTTMTAVVTLKQ